MDKSASFYCGDAAGRKQAGFDDFSSDDIVFSINLGLKFYTPEMLFKGDSLNFKPLPGVRLDNEYQSSIVEEVHKHAIGCLQFPLFCMRYMCVEMSNS